MTIKHLHLLLSVSVHFPLKRKSLIIHVFTRKSNITDSSSSLFIPYKEVASKKNDMPYLKTKQSLHQHFCVLSRFIIGCTPNFIETLLQNIDLKGVARIFNFSSAILRHPFVHLWAFAGTGFDIGRGEWVTANAFFAKIHPSLAPQPPTTGGERRPTAPYHREKRFDVPVAGNQRFCDWYAWKSSAAVFWLGNFRESEQIPLFW